MRLGFLSHLTLEEPVYDACSSILWRSDSEIFYELMRRNSERPFVKIACSDLHPENDLALLLLISDLRIFLTKLSLNGQVRTVLKRQILDPSRISKQARMLPNATPLYLKIISNESLPSRPNVFCGAQT